MTTRVRKSRLHTALSAAIDINIKSCISDWCKNQFAGWFGTLPLFPNPNLGFHFQKCSRKIFMERAHTHTFARLLRSLSSYLEPFQAKSLECQLFEHFSCCYFITNIKSCSTVTKNDIYTNIATGFYVTLARALTHDEKSRKTNERRKRRQQQQQQQQLD